MNVVIVDLILCAPEFDTYADEEMRTNLTSPGFRLSSGVRHIYSNTVNYKVDVKNRQSTVNFCSASTCEHDVGIR